MPNYIKVAKVNEVPPGTIREFQANGKVIALSNIEGKFYAIDNTCLHRGGPLGAGALEGEVVTCPWHGWEYKVSTGEAVFNPEIQVQKYDVKVEGDDIAVGFDA